MLSKIKKTAVGSRSDAHQRLQAVIQSQRAEISNQHHVDEKNQLASALKKATAELKELKRSLIDSDGGDEIGQRKLMPEPETSDALNLIPRTWKAPSSVDAETLRKRIDQEENALALALPIVGDQKLEECHIEAKPHSTLDLDLAGKIDASTSSDGISSPVRAPAVKPAYAPPAFKDFLKSKAGLSGATTKTTVATPAELPASFQPGNISLAIEDSLKKLEANINKTPSELDYEIDFSIDGESDSNLESFDEDSIPVLTEKVAGSSKQGEDVLCQTSEVASSFTMPISALLSSWLLSISRKSSVIGVIQRNYLNSDEHENRDLHLFSDSKTANVANAHCLTRLNDWHENSTPQPGVFHVFRPKFSSLIGKDSALLTRPQNSACFYKWVTPITARGDQTVLQAFVEKQLPYLHETVSRQVTDLWKVARESKSSGIALSIDSVSDLSARNRVYESTKVLLSRPLLSTLWSKINSGEALLIDHLSDQDSIKSVSWSDIPWSDYPPQLFLFHLLAEISNSTYCSLSSARVLGLLDKILMLTPCLENREHNLFYISLLEKHSDLQSGVEGSSMDDTFSVETAQVIKSDEIDSDIYENPGLEVYSREDGLQMVRGPLISTLSNQFSSLRSNLRELGLFRPELSLLCKEIQAK